MKIAFIGSHRGLMLAGAATLAIGSLAMQPRTAQAEDRLLDRGNDGVVDAATDNDGGANSNDADLNLACGVNAQAKGADSTSVGANSRADHFASAVGVNAQATGTNSTSIGTDSLAAQEYTSALGKGARAFAAGMRAHKSG